MMRSLRTFAARAREDLAENRAARILVLVLVLMVAGLAALAAGGNGFGLRGLGFVAGGIVGGAAVAVAAQSPRARKTALVLGVAALPASWVVIGVLPGGAFGAGSSNAAAAAQGFGMCAAIQGLMGLFGPGRRV